MPKRWFNVSYCLSVYCALKNAAVKVICANSKEGS